MAKKRANKTKSNMGGSDEEPLSRYFLSGGKAYVEVQSGDVFGPYEKGTAAYKRAAKDSLSGRTAEFGTRSLVEGMKSFMRGGGLRRGSM
jgi:hypothetical protein